MGLYLCAVNRARYSDELLSAYREFLRSADYGPLQSILEDVLPLLGSVESSGPGFLDDPVEVYEEFGMILRGEQFYSRSGDGKGGGKTSKDDLFFFVERILAPALFAQWCVARRVDFNVWESMNDPDLTQFLSAHSRWIEDRLTFAKEFTGEFPEIVVGEWSRFLSEEEVKTLCDELARMPRPSEGKILSDLENLRAIGEAARTDRNTAILACIV